MMDFANLVPVRESGTELGWLRSVVKFVSAECRAETSWAKRFKSAKSQQHPDVKAFCDELRPFCWFANSLDLPDTTVFALKQTGHRKDIEYLLNDAMRGMQITSSFSDTKVLHPHILPAEQNKFSAGYQHSLANEVSRREGFASTSSLYLRDKEGRAVVIEESERMYTADQLTAALISGLKAAVRRKVKPGYRDCELLVWHAEYEGYYNPDYRAVAQSIWEPDFCDHFEAVHIVLDAVRVSFDASGSIATH